MPYSSDENKQAKLDQMKVRKALIIFERFSLDEIRNKSLTNLLRWKASGAWCTAYDEWEELMKFGSEHEIREAMTGQTERSNRLRQSPPYVGLMGNEEFEF